MVHGVSWVTYYISYLIFNGSFIKTPFKNLQYTRTEDF